MTDKYEALRKAAKRQIASCHPDVESSYRTYANPQAILELLAERDALRDAAAKALHALEQLDEIDTETESVTIYVSDEIDALRDALGAPQCSR